MTAALSEDNCRVLSIVYFDDSGYLLQGGTKRALNSLSLTLDSDDEAATALDSVLDAQKSAQDETSELVASTPLNRRSIAFLDLWTGDQGLEKGRGQAEETQMMEVDDEVSSPLQQLSQRHYQSVVGHIASHGPAEDDTASESSFLGAQQDKSSFKNKLDAVQDIPENTKKSLAFTKAADKAVERSRSRSRARQPPGATMESTTNIPSHLPSKQMSKSRPLVPIFKDSARPTAKNKGPARAGSAFTSKPLPPVSASETPPERRPLASKSTNQRPAPSKTAPAKKRAAGGPMARLVPKQPQATEQKKKGESQAATGLKRKAQDKPKPRQDQNVDWEESFREEASFDIPEDTSQDERPTKKVKTRGSKTTAKPASTSKQNAPATKSTKQLKPPKRTAKKALSKPAARLQQKAGSSTLAATRQRRTANKKTTYEESSGSSVDEASSEHGEEAQSVKPNPRPAASRPDQSSAKRPKPTPDNADEASHQVLSPDKAQRKAVTGINEASAEADIHANVPSSPLGAELDLDSFVYVQDDATAAADEEVAEDSHPAAKGTEITQVTIAKDGEGTEVLHPIVKSKDVRTAESGSEVMGPDPNRQVKRHPSIGKEENDEEEIAEESYPAPKGKGHAGTDMDEEEDVAHDSDPAAAGDKTATQKATGTSFGTKLNAMIKPISTNKENVLPQPPTPFGDRKNFVISVNAARSASPKLMSLKSKKARTAMQAPLEKEQSKIAIPNTTMNRSASAKRKKIDNSGRDDLAGKRLETVEEPADPHQTELGARLNLEARPVSPLQVQVDDEQTFHPDVEEPTEQRKSDEKPPSERAAKTGITHKNDPHLNAKQRQAAQVEAGSAERVSKGHAPQPPLSIEDHEVAREPCAGLQARLEESKLHKGKATLNLRTSNTPKHEDSHMSLTERVARPTSPEVVVFGH